MATKSSLKCKLRSIIRNLLTERFSVAEFHLQRSIQILQLKLLRNKNVTLELGDGMTQSRICYLRKGL